MKLIVLLLVAVRSLAGRGRAAEEQDVEQLTKHVKKLRKQVKNDLPVYAVRNALSSMTTYLVMIMVALLIIMGQSIVMNMNLNQIADCERAQANNSYC
jgi:hypothetical protein